MKWGVYKTLFPLVCLLENQIKNVEVTPKLRISYFRGYEKILLQICMTEIKYCFGKLLVHSQYNITLVFSVVQTPICN